MRKEEKSVRKSPSGIIYRATPHLSQAARVSTCCCLHARLFGYSRLLFWDTNLHVLTREHVLLLARATVRILPASLLGHESARAHTCCLGQVRSGPVYYTARRLPNTLFLHLLVLLYQRVKYVDLLLLHTSNYIIRVTKSR